MNPSEMSRFSLCIQGSIKAFIGAFLLAPWALPQTRAEDQSQSSTGTSDFLRTLQFEAIEDDFAHWGHWGAKRMKFSDWTNHSNRLIPVYTFGLSLKQFTGEKSVFRSEDSLKEIYGRVPPETLNSEATYLDQTDIYRLQKAAIEGGKKNIILVVFDGMDWPTTRAAAIYNTGQITYVCGRGSGLHFLEYRGTDTDYNFMVTSPHNSGTDFDTNAQTVANPGGEKQGGYSVDLGGSTPWAKVSDHEYLLGKRRSLPHVVTDSAASATSMCSGIKTFNGAINVDPNGNQVEPIARHLQSEGYSIGVVTSVPISHATPASAYGNNVTRNDYQDLSRDLLGIRSIAHRGEALPGVDVLIGGGWGENKEEDEKQGENFVPGNKYLTEKDLRNIDVNNGGKYRIAQRTESRIGTEVLSEATDRAIAEKTRLFGYFGVGGGHLPYQTADGAYNPTRGAKEAERYSHEDVSENVTLADMTRSALRILEQNEKGFWLMVEAGDVDWGNHDNNLDNAIGAVLSGDDAFRVVTDWIEQNDAWNDTAVILTADHGHYLMLKNSQILTGQGR